MLNIDCTEVKVEPGKKSGIKSTHVFKTENAELKVVAKIDNTSGSAEMAHMMYNLADIILESDTDDSALRAGL